MKNIIIFGGSFDPIHNGHMNMALCASKQLNADVLFVPARISVWKDDSAPIKDKINMINEAIKSFNAQDIMSVSTIEADSKKNINYTIDTVKQLLKIYNEANLYLLIGTDQVNSFEKWKDCDELAKLTRIIYFEREKYKLNSKNINRFNMLKIDGKISGASSTNIRQLKELDTPYSVINYIIDHNLYFMPKISCYLSDKRLIHSISVARLSYEIAKSNNLPIFNECFIAGLLHDIGKNLSKIEESAIMDCYFKEYKSLNYKIYHQFTGSYLANTIFEIKNEQILNAIKYHTTGKKNMTDIEKIVYCSDKIDPNRGFDSKPLIDSIKVNLNNGFITILKANKVYFEDNNISFDNFLTNECMKYYLK